MRDAARVLGYPYVVGDKIAKLMPPLIMGRDTPLHACFEQQREVRRRLQDGDRAAPALRRRSRRAAASIDVARGLEGLRRQDGIHAAAVVITREPLTEYLPIQRKPEPGTPIEDAPIVTQYEMHGVEDLGLLKMDFLGLRNLDVMEITLDLIEQSTGARPDIDDAPARRPEDVRAAARGPTRSACSSSKAGRCARCCARWRRRRSKTSSAVLALYRPGPMAQNWHNEYADRKNGRKPVTFDHPDLEEILGPTYGLMIYQEQLMRVSQKLAGYSLEEADNLRKATGKKIRELIAKERTKFVEGCVAQRPHARSSPRATSTRSSRSPTTRSTSRTRVGYGFITYQTAWLKANYPVQYLAALLTSVKTQPRQGRGLPQRVPAARDPGARPRRERVGERLLLRVRRRDQTGAVRFGLSAVRNVGEGVSALLIEERAANGPFADFHDFCDRVDPTVLNKRTIESLINGGGVRLARPPPQGPAASCSSRSSTPTLRRRRERDAGHDEPLRPRRRRRPTTVAGVRRPPPDPRPRVRQDASGCALEKEMLGLYVSDHPLMGAERALRRHVECSIAELAELDDGTMRTVAGVVTGAAAASTPSAAT